jgi:hypothetical protein
MPETEENSDESMGNSTETNDSSAELSEEFLDSEENFNSGNSTEINDDSEESSTGLSSVSVLNTELITNDQNTTEAIGTTIADS